MYGVWGVLRGQLLTDDSFVFNRVLTRLKASVANLAPAEEADETALAAAQARAPSPGPSGQALPAGPAGLLRRGHSVKILAAAARRRRT